MTPPLVAQALVAAAAPPADYESIAGDLHEEYMRRVARSGVADANRWYWSQALASIPPLLSYSRVQRSVWNALAITCIAIFALLTLLFATDVLDSAMHAACRGACPTWMIFSANWVDAAVFGAMLALLVRTGGVRFVLFCALFLVASIVVPTLLGFSSRLPLIEWLLLFGAVPAMGAGAAFYQILRRRPKDG